MPLSYAAAHAQLLPTMRRLHRGFDPDWGWWVSDDFVSRVYSSHSSAQAEENYIALQAERISE